MKVIGLDGRTHTWSPSTKTNHQKRSKLHLRARYVIKKVYPASVVLEEVFLPGVNLYADFIIFGSRIMIEVQGQQHFEFNSKFHKSKADFVAQQLKDDNKAEWCKLNNFRLILLPYNETDDEWQNRISSKALRTP